MRRHVFLLPLMLAVVCDASAAEFETFGAVSFGDGTPADHELFQVGREGQGLLNISGGGLVDVATDPAKGGAIIRRIPRA